MANSINMDTSWKGVKMRAAARNESRLFIEVEHESGNGLQVGDEYLQPGPGPHRAVIYVGDLPAIQALVRSEEQKAALAWAKSTYDAQVAEIRAKYAKPDEALDVRSEQRMAHDLMQMPDNIYSILSVNPKFKAGLGPILSLKVIEDVPPPPTVENIAAQSNAQLAEAIREAVHGTASRVPSKDELAEFIRSEIEKGIASYIDSTTKPKK